MKEKSFSKNFKKYFFLILCLGLSQLSLGQNNNYYKLEQIPSTIRKAVAPSAILKSNSLNVSLERKTSGQIKLLAQLESFGDFKIYEESVHFESLPDDALGGSSWKVTVLSKPERLDFLDPISKKVKHGYQGQAAFELLLEIPQSINGVLPNNHSIPLIISFQACSSELCLLPARVLIPVGTQISKSSTTKPPVSLSARLSQMLKNSLNGGKWSLSVILILFLAGVITSLTPCVYPLYPITLGIFSRWTKASHVSPFWLANSYSLGLTLSYALFGLVTVATGTLFGSLTQRPEYLMAMGILFLLAAVMFSGAIQLQAPLALQNFIAKFSFVKEGQPSSKFAYIAQSFFMGLTLGILAAPCVGPVLVALLGWLSTSFIHGHKDYLHGFLLLSLFGVGMSTPFMIMGHFVLKMHKKVQLGPYTSIIKNIGTLLFVVASLAFLIPGIRLLNPTESVIALNYEVFSYENRPKNSWKVLDFRADWCTACLQLERETFSDSKVSELFKSKQWAYVQIDLSTPSPDNEKITRSLNVLSLPSVLFEAPDGKICNTHTLNEFEDPNAFVIRLDKAKSDCK
ncbi:MAG: sulfite exporter TauE/SafE family protein [Proteobacteria bacterium]|nr:sulfite exporter TauE/SafE family protein [Pseudomonadota bacterium]